MKIVINDRYAAVEIVYDAHGYLFEGRDGRDWVWLPVVICRVPWGAGRPLTEALDTAGLIIAALRGVVPEKQPPGPIKTAPGGMHSGG